MTDAEVIVWLAAGRPQAKMTDTEYDQWFAGYEAEMLRRTREAQEATARLMAEHEDFRANLFAMLDAASSPVVPRPELRVLQGGKLL